MFTPSPVNQLQLNPKQLKRLEDILLNENGTIRQVSFAELKKFTQNDISVFCWKHAVYQLPTTELIEWLKKEIGDTKAIEIGAGNGCFGRILNIPSTDLMLQKRFDIKRKYMLSGQPLINYGNNVIEMEADKAIEHFKPETVIATWVTQKFSDDWRDTPTGNIDGVNEIGFPKKIKRYIHVGNELTHAQKAILNLPHKEYKFAWLISRSMHRGNNIIYDFKF